MEASQSRYKGQKVEVEVVCSLVGGVQLGFRLSKLLPRVMVIGKEFLQHTDANERSVDH